MARSENNLNAVLQDTANAIRAKDGTTEKICPRDFADKINAIPTPTGTLQITQNGEQDVTSYATVDVQVPSQPAGVPSPNVRSSINAIEAIGSIGEDFQLTSITCASSREYQTESRDGVWVLRSVHDSDDIVLSTENEVTIEVTLGRILNGFKVYIPFYGGVSRVGDPEECSHTGFEHEWSANVPTPIPDSDPIRNKYIMFYTMNNNFIFAMTLGDLLATGGGS